MIENVRLFINPKYEKEYIMINEIICWGLVIGGFVLSYYACTSISYKEIDIEGDLESYLVQVIEDYNKTNGR